MLDPTPDEEERAAGDTDDVEELEAAVNPKTRPVLLRVEMEEEGWDGRTTPPVGNSVDVRRPLNVLFSSIDNLLRLAPAKKKDKEIKCLVFNSTQVPSRIKKCRGCKPPENSFADNLVTPL